MSEAITSQSVDIVDEVRGTKAALKRTLSRLSELVASWIKNYVPRDTGDLIRSSHVTTIKSDPYYIQVKFTEEYAEYVDKMRQMGRAPKDPSRLAPFLEPLEDYIREKYQELLKEELTNEQLEAIVV
ncbi:MAG: hypothetical protein JRJ62_01570 [Deltaproteobacteria bacterium]|nr:hypothetical protein [Deltaproteobacteria bacterium]